MTFIDEISLGEEGRVEPTPLLDADEVIAELSFDWAVDDSYLVPIRVHHRVTNQKQWRDNAW